MEKAYKIKKADFNEDGFNKKDGEFFLDLLHEWEEDFYECNSPFFANHIFANPATMILMKNCWKDNTNVDCGRNSEIDYDTKCKIELYI